MNVEMGLAALRAVGVLLVAGPVLILIVGLVRGRRGSARAGSGGPPLWLRYLTLIGITCGLLLSAWVGELPFLAVVLALTAIGLGELWRVLEAAGLSGFPVAGTLGGMALVGASQLGGAAALGPALGLALLATLGLAALPGNRERGPVRVAATFLGLGIALLFAFVVLLRRQPTGFGSITFLWAVMQLNDAFSMLGGLAFGRRPLAPSLSPSKTWEGAVTGLLATGLGAPFFAFAVPALAGTHVVALALALALVGDLGGLCASALKRAAGRKDFGTVFPGHGGVLDRFDSTLFAALPMWLLLG